MAEDRPASEILKMGHNKIKAYCPIIQIMSSMLNETRFVRGVLLRVRAPFRLFSYYNNNNKR